MKIFRTSQIRNLDAYTIEHEPISSIDLMERAASAVCRELTERWTGNTPFIVFAGHGNNGGDALAVSRMLIEKGYEVTTYLFNPKGELSPDCAINRDRLEKTANSHLIPVATEFVPPVLTEDYVVVDGLFGSGLSRPLTGGFAAVVKYINASAATVVSIDIPSGLMGEDNSKNNPNTIVKADWTLTFQQPKLSFLFPENQIYVGEVSILDIGISKEAMAATYSDYEVILPENLKPVMRQRSYYSHKGDFGRACLIAGSQGMAGAAVLAARSCLRSGVGLLTVHTPICNNTILQTAVPEAMTDIDVYEQTFGTAVDSEMYDVIGMGPGLRKSDETVNAVLEQIDGSLKPMVLDADALNILGEHSNYIGTIPKGSVLTPHPVELDRLAGKSENTYERLKKARNIAMGQGVVVILKGANTFIFTPSGKCYINMTGNPGMATGGSGDVLTGIITALLAQKYAPEEAAILGVFVHGMAGDRAARKKGVTSLIAGDIVDSLSEVWTALEQ